MSDFIVNEEDFSLRPMQKVPEPGENERFLLYRTGADPGASMVISKGGRYSPTAIRHGHYNKKVTLSLQTLNFSQDFRIVMVDVDFYFNVNVEVSYKIQDVQKYFFQGRIADGSLSNMVRECVRKQNKRWNVSQGWELQNNLEEQIEKELRHHPGVEFQHVVEVTPDEDALAMQQSNKDKVVGIHTSNNKTKEQIAINADKARVVDSEFKYKIEQLKDMAFMIQNFGDLGPIVNEYLQGSIDGVKLREYIIKSKTDDMNLLKVAMDTEMLTQMEAIDKFNAILEGKRFTQADQQLLGENRVEPKALQEDEEQEDEKECDSYIEDGFV